jgi:hypothetical protein
VASKDKPAAKILWSAPSKWKALRVNFGFVLPKIMVQLKYLYITRWHSGQKEASTGQRGNGKDRGLDRDGSTALCDQLGCEAASLGSGAETAQQWARAALPAKDTLTAADARLLEVAFELRLSALRRGAGSRNFAREA